MSEFGADPLFLDPEENEGYGNWVLPCARDEEIATYVRAQSEPDATRPRPSAHVVLLAFAERMASLARRQQAPEHLRIGLAAAGLAAENGDRREVLTILPLLWRSAEVLGLDAGEEFREATRHLPSASTFRAFGDRAPEDRSIDSMGYVEVDDDLGFRYERTW